MRVLPGEGDGQDSLSERVEAAPTAARTPGGPRAQEAGQRHLHVDEGIVLLQFLLFDAPRTVGQQQLSTRDSWGGTGRQRFPRRPGDKGRRQRTRAGTGDRGPRRDRGTRCRERVAAGGQQADPSSRSRFGRAALLAAAPLVVLQQRPSIQRNVGEEGQGSLAAPRVHARLTERLGFSGGRRRRRRLHPAGGRRVRAAAVAAVAAAAAGGRARGGSRRRHCVRLRRQFRGAREASGGCLVLSGGREPRRPGLGRARGAGGVRGGGPALPRAGHARFWALGRR